MRGLRANLEVGHSVQKRLTYKEQIKACLKHTPKISPQRDTALASGHGKRTLN